VALSTDYLKTLKDLAQAKYTADVGVVEGEFKRKAGGRVTGTGAQATYKSPEQVKAEGGTPEYGELDIAYERNREGLEGGLESRGILRSGQAATSRGRMASDYQQSVLDYYNAMTSKKGALGAQYAFDVADLEAKYGKQTQKVAAPKSPKVTDNTPATPSTPPSMSLPAAQRSPETAAAAMALGQPENRQAATGRVPVASTLQTYTEPMTAAAYMALGQAQSRAAVTSPKPKTPPTPPKPAAPAKPAARAPVKKPTTTKVR